MFAQAQAALLQLLTWMEPGTSEGKNDERTCTAQAALWEDHGYTLNHENPSKLPAQAMPVGSLGAKCSDQSSIIV